MPLHSLVEQEVTGTTEGTTGTTEQTGTTEATGTAEQLIVAQPKRHLHYLVEDHQDHRNNRMQLLQQKVQLAQLKVQLVICRS